MHSGCSTIRLGATCGDVDGITAYRQVGCPRLTNETKGEQI